MTDASGVVINQTQYKDWGETRYSSGTEQTKYQYTGQYSYASDFGLHFYNARWYDSSLGRFTQADSIVPSAGSPEAWDRYSYTNNNPVRYTDPSGHCTAGGFWMPDSSPACKYSPSTGTIATPTTAPITNTPITISDDMVNSLADYAFNEENIKYSTLPKSDVANNINLILNTANGYDNLSIEEVAYILATAHWESHMGFWMSEDLSENTDGYEGDVSLGNIYPGDGRWFRGRGFIHITGRNAYAKMSVIFNMDLIQYPDLVATNPALAAAISVDGMVNGTFSTYKLSDYRTAGGYDFVGARAIVNGNDNADVIAKIAKGYFAILSSYTHGK